MVLACYGKNLIYTHTMGLLFLTLFWAALAFMLFILFKVGLKNQKYLGLEVLV
jgi:hypothetical protein